MKSVNIIVHILGIYFLLASLFFALKVFLPFDIGWGANSEPSYIEGYTTQYTVTGLFIAPLLFSIYSFITRRRFANNRKLGYAYLASWILVLITAAYWLYLYSK